MLTINVSFQFKVALQSKNEGDIKQEIEAMSACSDFEVDYLALAAHEAVASNAPNIAVFALNQLIIQAQNGCQLKTSEAVIFRNLIQLTQKADESADTSEQYQSAARRLLAAGFSSFFGELPEGSREAKWFAGSSWNLGIEAGKSQDWKRSARYLCCAAEFFASMPESPDVLQSKRLAFLLSASSLLSSASDATVAEQALTLLDKCSKVNLACQIQPHFIALF